MGKKKMKLNNRKIRKRNTSLVLECLEQGITSVKMMASSTGLSRSVIHTLMKHDEELKAKYIIARKQLANQAADNIAEIINDPDHPHNFQASKFILGRFKSNLDDHLESVDDDEITAGVHVDMGNEDDKGSVTIVFKNKKQRLSLEEDDD